MSSLNLYLDKLKKLPQDKLATAAVALLLIYIASILANLSYLVIPGSQTAGNGNIGAPNRAAQGQAKSQQGSVNISALTSLNVFGSYVKPEDAPKVEQPVVQTEDIPETNLNLTLAATVAENNNSGLGTAIIQSGNAQSTYGVDDKIDGTTAIVKQVFTDRVIIQNGMRRETLMLDGVEYDRMNVARPIDDPNEVKSLNQPKDPDRYTDDEKSDGDQKDDRRNDKRLTERLSEKKRDISENPMKLYDLIRFSPVRNDGELAGYRLNPGKDPDLFKQAGFRPDDLAVEVNGTPLNDMKAAMQILREFREMTEANIVVERDGVRQEILFSLDAANASRDLPKKEVTRDGTRGLVEQ